MKLKITRNNSQRLHKEEWFMMHTHFKDEVLAYGAIKLRIDYLFPKYLLLYSLADGSIEQLSKSFFTKDIAAQDEHRSLIYRGMRENVRALRNFPDPLKRKTAEELFAVIENYAKNIIAANLAAKTAAIGNLLQDLTGAKGGEDMTAQVALLGIEAWVESLQNANEAYKNTLKQRYEEYENKPEPGRLARLRVEIDHLFILMLSVIDSQLAVIDETDTDEDGEKTIQFAKALNIRLAYFKTLIEQRKTKKKSVPV